jgi:hypothetical protein
MDVYWQKPGVTSCFHRYIRETLINLTLGSFNEVFQYLLMLVNIGQQQQTGDVCAFCMHVKYNLLSIYQHDMYWSNLTVAHEVYVVCVMDFPLSLMVARYGTCERHLVDHNCYTFVLYNSRVRYWCLCILFNAGFFLCWTSECFAYFYGKVMVLQNGAYGKVTVLQNGAYGTFMVK